jgi:hypothetical protein|tara:strand:+ start:1882 stop:2814 length:933 start_codon:yes stop_codon:yes gene_type:complete
MDPFTLALATFGVQKLRGKSTKRALRDAAIIGGGSYALGASGIGPASFQNPALSSIGMQNAKPPMPKGDLGTSFLNRANMPKGTVIGVDKFGKDIISRGGELSGLNVVDASSKDGIAANLLKKAKDKPLETAFLASSVLPLLADEEEDKPMITEEDYKKAYTEQAANLEGAFVPAINTRPTLDETINNNMFYANQGGLATAIPKFNKGGVNYLPSKTDHNENDYNNYVRAEGYVEDGTGNGNKDEDTMLAQLADGEFVSRADAVLGAGILSGADPKSFKNMRKAGADFFYDQQKKFKRIYDIVNASRKDN